MSTNRVSIHKEFVTEDKTEYLDVTVEEITNGWLMTVNRHEISRMEEKGPVYDSENYTTEKTYYKKNPLSKDSEIWELFEF